ncbi:MAG: hypothetical protein PSV35_10070 [bacterium]|nr:hypothetical protein [bacterium]
MSDFKDLKNDAKHKSDELYEKAKDKASSTYEQVKDRASSTYENVRDNAEHLAHQAKNTASELYNEGRRKVTDVCDATCEHTENLAITIRNKPLTSVLVAAGVGFILSQLFKK